MKAFDVESQVINAVKAGRGAVIITSMGRVGEAVMLRHEGKNVAARIMARIGRGWIVSLAKKGAGFTPVPDTRTEKERQDLADAWHEYTSGEEA